MQLTIYYDKECNESILNTLNALNKDLFAVQPIKSKSTTETLNDISEKCKTKYFTYIGKDIKNISTTCFNKFLEYEDGLKDTSFGFICFVYKGEQLEGTANEYVWSFGATQKQGFLDFEKLKEMDIYNFDLVIYNTENFTKSGKMKPNFLKKFDYEFMLRNLNNGNKFFVVPHYGYSVQRVTTTDEDKALGGKFLGLARKEYYFAENRSLKM